VLEYAIGSAAVILETGLPSKRGLDPTARVPFMVLAFGVLSLSWGRGVCEFVLPVEEVRASRASDGISDSRRG
jgi:hypothetical protein